MKKILIACGILAPIIYLATVVLGGLLRPGYSHISQAISELLTVWAPNKPLLDALMAIYNVLSGLCAVGLLLLIRASRQSKGRSSGILAAILLLVQVIFGLLTLIFPQDQPGLPATTGGTLHLILAGGSSLTSMLTILLMGFWFRGADGFRSFGTYSFISVGIVFLSGGLAAASAASASPLLGLVERITIGAYLQWLFVIAFRLFGYTIRRQSA
ncbi:MAG: DUF998 domain-containing protein [Anaerolineae bacterium]